MRVIKILMAGVLAGVCLMISPAFAEQPLGLQHEPLGIELGPGWRLYPSLDVRAVYDTNFFYTPKEKDEVFGVLTKPGLAVIRRGEQVQLDFGGHAEVGRYDTRGGNDNYVDGEVFLQLRYRPASRHHFSTRLSRVYGHDPFGERRTQGLPTEDRELDEFHRDLAHLQYRFGVPQALFNAQYDLFYRNKEYDTNRAMGTRFLDFKRIENRGTFYLNYSPKSSGLLQLSHRDIEYSVTRPPALPTRDAEEWRALVGVEWLATAKTSGHVLVGAIRREPKDPNFEDVRGFDWDIEITWTPRIPTSFTLTSGRETAESFLLEASVIDTRRVGVSWKQQWSYRLSSSLELQYAEREFEATRREDEFVAGIFGLNYAVSKSLSIYGIYTHEDRDSTTPESIFDKSTFSLGFRYAP